MSCPWAARYEADRAAGVGAHLGVGDEPAGAPRRPPRPQLEAVGARVDEQRLAVGAAGNPSGNTVSTPSGGIAVRVDGPAVAADQAEALLPRRLEQGACPARGPATGPGSRAPRRGRRPRRPARAGAPAGGEPRLVGERLGDRGSPRAGAHPVALLHPLLVGHQLLGPQHDPRPARRGTARGGCPGPACRRPRRTRQQQEPGQRRHPEAREDQALGAPLAARVTVRPAAGRRSCASL